MIKASQRRQSAMITSVAILIPAIAAYIDGAA